MKTEIKIQRYPYEEPHLLNLHFKASNGTFAGFLEFYCNTEELIEMGNKLSNFAQKVPDEYIYEVGSTKKKDNFAYHFYFRVYTIDKVGHSAIQVIIDNNETDIDEGACKFKIPAEPIDINKLGDLLLHFSKLEHKELYWTPSGDENSLK